MALSLCDTKQFLRITHDNEDTLINKLISIATQKLEEFSGLALIKRQFSNKFYQKTLQKHAHIKISRRPLAEVLKIEATGFNGEKTSIPKNLYAIIDDSSIEYYFHTNYAHIQVEYIAGLTEKAAELDATLQHALLEMVAHLYECRGNNMALDDILERYPSLRNFKL